MPARYGTTSHTSPMPLTKLSIAVADLAAADRVLAALATPELPEALASTAFEAPGGGYVAELYYDREVAPDAVQRALTAAGAGTGEPVQEVLPETNWVAVSQASLPPVVAGRFIVHGSHDRVRFTMRRTAIEIEAGEAFGTGHNATTTLCLGALDRLAHARSFRRVVDVGCGTGVLALAAARVFPKASVVATDNDPIATGIARDNVRLNRLLGRVAVIDAAGFAHPRLRGLRADLILANILPGPLIGLAPVMRQRLVRGGVAVLCGLLTHQVREVAATYQTAGFRLTAKDTDAGWAALTVQRC
jgi:ribosomal protein L11 methyltransferase